MKNLVSRLEKLKAFSDNLKKKIEDLNDQNNYLVSIDELAQLALSNQDAKINIKIMFDVEYPEAIKQNEAPQESSAQELLETLCGSQDPDAFTKNLGMLRHKLSGGRVETGEKVNLSETVRLENLDNVVFLSIMTMIYSELKEYNIKEQQKIAKIIEKQESKLKLQ